MANPPIELWQLYDEQGRALTGQGGTKDDVYGKALLHAASHVWIWRQTSTGVEILLQKRALNKRTWGGRYDISAAGHIDLGEDPLTAAIRETQEEIGYSVNESDLLFIGAHRAHMPASPDGSLTENEFRFIYLLELPNNTEFSLGDGEVDSLEWKPLEKFKQETAQSSKGEKYVPHGEAYFGLLLEAIERFAK